MNKTTVSKFFSTSLSLALAVTSAPWPAGAVGPVSPAAPAFAARFSPPERFGYVASSFSPNKDASAPRLILISDLHAHVEVQHNIVGMLHDIVGKLNPTSGRKVPIFVEGGWENNLEEPLRNVKNSGVRSFLSEYYLQKSEINASQAYSEDIAGSAKVTLIGVESKQEYMANRARFVKTYPERKSLLLAIEREESALKVLSDNISGSYFKKVQSMRDEYLAGRISPERYASALSRLARKYGIGGSQVAVLKQAGSAGASELEVAFSEVYRQVVRASASQKPLSALLRRSLENEDTVRQNLARIDASLDLLKRLVADQLTPAEVTLSIVRMPELIEVAQLLLDKDPMKDKAAQIVRESFDFYPFAQLRDKSLCDNALKALGSFGAESTGILVTGGFHTDAIADRLRSKNISYVVIHPSITRDLTTLEQLNYVKRVGGEHVTPVEMSQDIEALRRGDVISSSPAGGTVAGLEPPREQKSMGGGVANEALALQMLAGRETALTEQLRQAEAVVSAAPVNVNAPNIVEATKQLQSVMGTEYGAIESDIKWDGTITLDFGIKNAEDNGTRALASVLNGVIQAVDGGAVNAKDIERIHLVEVSNEAAITKMKAEGKIFWNEGDHSRTIVLSTANMRIVRHLLDQIGKLPKGSAAETALNQALHTLIHEAVHAFDKQGKSETSTNVKAMAVTAVEVFESVAATGGEGEARDAVMRLVVNAIIPQLLNSKEGAKFARTPNLGEFIANLINPNLLPAENVQRIFDALMKKYSADPVSPFQIQQAIDQEMGAASTRVRHALSQDVEGDTKDLEKRVEETVGEDAAKAKKTGINLSA